MDSSSIPWLDLIDVFYAEMQGQVKLAGIVFGGSSWIGSAQGAVATWSKLRLKNHDECDNLLNELAYFCEMIQLSINLLVLTYV